MSLGTKQQSWEGTKLWKELKRRAGVSGDKHEAAKEMLPSVQQWLKKIEKVLVQGHTDPQDFTLHDQQHSFRVAQRMMELIRPVQVKHLSDYEVALLLLSAYLHDIGMTPERKKVDGIRRVLLTDDKEAMPPSEIADLQHWLDENQHDLNLTGPRPPVSPDYLDLVDEITTYYVRQRHNDWSKEWIEKNLSGSMHHLGDWQSVLILLCQSHHMDHQQLRANSFDPRSVGNHPPLRLHLRHLACVLRVADILENSPDRVPRIIFQHRNINTRPKSFIHWEIPHQLEIPITDDVVHVRAAPLEARYEKAIRNVADEIDKELTGCAAIAKDMPFDRNPVIRPVVCDWFIAPACIRSIRAHHDAYEYIDGAFRPNTPKLLQLLSGTQLYDSPFAAVRELVQNAFDAVREKMAYQRLRETDAHDPKWEAEFGKRENVTLTLTQDTDGTLRLTCHDTGCGMTRQIIEKHLLVSGDARRPALIDLERKCESKGFHLNRTGQFGIGVLSYFMMAKSVRIETCRLQDCGDLDAPGWTFTTTGVGDFGELRKMSKTPITGPGTTIEWALDKGKFSDAGELGAMMETYLREQIIKTPCCFRLQSVIDCQNHTYIDFNAGWTHTHEDIIRIMTSDWPHGQSEERKFSATESDKSIADLREFQERMEGWVAEARQTLRMKERIVSLPNNCGTARIVLPWFELPEGPALAYVLFARQADARTFAKQQLLLLSQSNLSAWRGIRAAVQGEGAPTNIGLLGLGWVSYDFDHVSGSHLQVHRSTMQMEKALQQSCLKLARSTLIQMANELQASNKQRTFYRTVNDILLNRYTSLASSQAYWVRSGEGTHFQLTAFPAIGFSLSLQISGTNGQPLGRGKAHWQGQEVSCLHTSVKIQKDRYLLTHCVPERILAAELPNGHFVPVGFWNGVPAPSVSNQFLGFPPQWSDVFACIIESSGYLLNDENWAVKLIRNAEPNWNLSTLLNEPPNWENVETSVSPSQAALTLMRGCRDLTHEKLKNLQLHDPDLLPRLWTACADAVERPHEDLILHYMRSDQIRSLSYNTFYSGYLDISNKPPDLKSVTDPEWLITIEK